MRSCIECKKGDIVGKIHSSLEVSSSKVLLNRVPVDEFLRGWRL